MHKGRIAVSLFFISFYSILLGQKTQVDSNVYGRWPYVNTAVISNNGSYVSYMVSDPPSGVDSLHIQSTKTSWKVSLPSHYNCTFSSNSQFAVFEAYNNRIGVLELGTYTIKYVANIKSYRTPKDAALISYQTIDNPTELVVWDLQRGREVKFSTVENYSIDNKGKLLLLQSRLDNIQSLRVVNTTTLQEKVIWSGFMSNNFLFDQKSEQFVFAVKDSISTESRISYWYYKIGDERANLLLSNHDIAKISGKVELGALVRFSKDGGSVFFKLIESGIIDNRMILPNIEVWSYTDKRLFSAQTKLPLKNNYLSIINLKNREITRLENENEVTDYWFSENNQRVDDIILVRKTKDSTYVSDRKPGLDTFSIVFTKNGERKNIGNSVFADLSITSKYVVFYDHLKADFFSFNTRTGAYSNLTKGIKVNWTGYNDPGGSPIYNIYHPVGIGGWTENDSAIYVYDSHDVWQLDLTGEKRPLNITRYVGKNTNTVFRLAFDYRWKSVDSEKLLLNAFNRTTKENGYYIKNLNNNNDPQLLTKGPFIYHVPDEYIGTAPIRAKDTAIYIIHRESATESVNLFWTSDFIEFKQVSANYPERNFNWFKPELHSWHGEHGKLQGVLYKPENFNPKQKYPVIFYIYNRQSDNLNLFRLPEASRGIIDIPTYVSNGYLVFTPDIIFHSKISPGDNALNSVVSAVSYLSKLKYINTKKIGINGHSWGGYEVNYIITKTNLFAAACSGSAVTDCFSFYGTIINADGNNAGPGSYVPDKDPWVDPLAFAKNSPLLHAGKIITPLLIFNTKNDDVVPYTQGIEFFIALRELRKKVWMTMYNDGNHIVKGSSSKDFTIRLGQFFDHYLKDKPMPRWMKTGLPIKTVNPSRGYEILN